MPIFGPNVQTSTVGSGATVAVFNPNAAPWVSGTINGVSYPGVVGPLKDPIIENTGSVTVFLGSSTVTAATGLPLAAGQQITYNGFSTATGSGGTALYAITNSGSTTVVTGLATLNVNE